jgi:uncharacterized FAD-dependent dehydrogenase
MGIVKLSDDMHDQLRSASKAFDRSLNSQAEHWIKIGMLSEFLPTKNYEELRNVLLKMEHLSIENILKLTTKK